MMMSEHAEQMQTQISISAYSLGMHDVFLILTRAITSEQYPVTS
jgi:hypothetical protein